MQDGRLEAPSDVASTSSDSQDMHPAENGQAPKRTGGQLVHCCLRFALCAHSSSVPDSFQHTVKASCCHASYTCHSQGGRQSTPSHAPACCSDGLAVLGQDRHPSHLLCKVQSAMHEAVHSGWHRCPAWPELECCVCRLHRCQERQPGPPGPQQDAHGPPHQQPLVPRACAPGGHQARSDR